MNLHAKITETGSLELTGQQKMMLSKYHGKKVTLSIEKPTRTSAQNNAIHLYLDQVAKELDREGHTLQDVVKSIRKAEIHPTKEALKEVVWRPIQQIMLKKDSTKELGKLDVDKVYEVVNKFIGENFHIHVPFPDIHAIGGFCGKKECGRCK